MPEFTQEQKDRIIAKLAELRAEVMRDVIVEDQLGDALERKLQIVGLFPNVPGHEGPRTLPFWLLYELMYDLHTTYRLIDEALGHPTDTSQPGRRDPKKLAAHIAGLRQAVLDIQQLLRHDWSDECKGKLNSLLQRVELLLRDASRVIEGRSDSEQADLQRRQVYLEVPGLH